MFAIFVFNYNFNLMVESQSEYSLTRADTAMSFIDDSIPELPNEILKLD
jgi:hypothetical protein